MIRVVMAGIGFCINNMLRYLCWMVIYVCIFHCNNRIAKHMTHIVHSTFTYAGGTFGIRIMKTQYDNILIELDEKHTNGVHDCDINVKRLVQIYTED